MVRRDAEERGGGSPPSNSEARCASPAGESPASVSVGAQRIRQRVKELTPRSRCHADLREVIADLNPVLRGWGQYFRTGNAAKRFNQLDTYVWRRLLELRVRRKGRHLRPREVERWTRDSFHDLGLHRLRGTVRYPEPAFFHKEAA